MKHSVIKAIICICIWTILSYSVPLPVCAEENVSFALDSLAPKNNRLIDIGLHAKSSRKLSAALFTFTYDASLLEFRGTKAPNGSKVVHRADNNKITVSYLCAPGADIADNPVILTLSFKTIAQGSTSVGFSVKECVDAATVDFMPVGACTAGQITIGGAVAATTVKPAKTTATKPPKATRAAPSAATPSSKIGDEGEHATSLNDLGTINSIVEQEPDRLTPVIVLCASGVAAVLFTIYFIYRIKNDKKRNDRHDS